MRHLVLIFLVYGAACLGAGAVLRGVKTITLRWDERLRAAVVVDALSEGVVSVLLALLTWALRLSDTVAVTAWAVLLIVISGAVLLPALLRGKTGGHGRGDGTDEQDSH